MNGFIQNRLALFTLCTISIAHLIERPKFPMTSQTQVTNLLLTLPPRQRTDLLRFESFKKWTCDLFAKIQHIDYSTAHRRLEKLVQVGLLDMKRGFPLPDGGREPNVYYPTALGARAITRLRDRQDNRVISPDVSNPIDNTHDLLTLETAYRSGCAIEYAQAFKEVKFIVRGQERSIIPDVVLHTPDETKLYIEVEQTSRPEHIRNKYQRYDELFSLPPYSDSLLVVFPDYDTAEMLGREHQRALEELQPLNRVRFLHMVMTSLRSAQFNEWPFIALAASRYNEW